MRKGIWLLLFPMLLAGNAAAQESPLEVRELRLSNGMQVWLNRDTSQPKVFGAVVVKAGGKDSPDTGLAHYLEHLLFKGTDRLGTVDYAAEKVWLDSIAVCYDHLAETQGAAERLAIQQEINRLSLRAADYAIPNEFDRLTAEFGGTGLNAATSYDYTFYFNTFSPQYMAQWAELNSHRMLNPVFRLFQGELETVYEEKNRAADNMMTAPMFEMIKTFSGGNAYSYPVIGSTENLKNPRLGEMMDFFRRYYVGNNMGLILVGDIQPDGLLPLLESTFGRIPAGEKRQREPVSAPVLRGARDVKVKAEIPMIKISVFAFNGPVDADPDAPALDLATALLTNSFSSGLMDSLMTAHKVLMAGASRIPMFNEMGVVGYVVVPSLPFGSVSKAEKLCREQVEKIKDGAFSDAQLEALKLEALRSRESGIETLSGRSEQMISVMSQDRSWADYLAEADAIRALTREDVIRVARKYFTGDYIRFEKVKGSYPKDKIAKPDFAPVLPRHAGEQSAYAQELSSMPVAERAPRLLDFAGDVERIPLGAHAWLYYKENPVNDLFSLTLQVDAGENEDPLIPHVAGFVNTVGTDSLTIQQLAQAWQQLGTRFSAGSDRHSFTLSIDGFDDRFTPSLDLLRHVTGHLKGDKESFKELKTAITLEKRTFLSGGTSNIMQAVMQRVFYGDRSPLLNGLTAKELDAVGMDGLLQAFEALMRRECTFFYCGSLPKEEVAARLAARFDLDRRTDPVSRNWLPTCRYDEPTVFFYDLPGSRQTQMMTYQVLPAPADDAERAALELLGEYVGGGMFSMMFQEVREFRALAYSASGGVRRPFPAEGPAPAILYTSLGTQADKSLAALQLVDSLLTAFPVKEAGLRAAARSLAAGANNAYPALREVGPKIHAARVKGYEADPQAQILGHLDAVTPAVLAAYHARVVQPAPRSYIIVGDRKALPMEEIARFGKIVELKKADIYK